VWVSVSVCLCLCLSVDSSSVWTFRLGIGLFLLGTETPLRTAPFLLGTGDPLPDQTVTQCALFSHLREEVTVRPFRTHKISKDACSCLNAHTRTHAHTHTHTLTRTHSHAHTHTHTLTRTHSHAHTHTHTLTRTHSHAQRVTLMTPRTLLGAHLDASWISVSQKLGFRASIGLVSACLRPLQQGYFERFLEYITLIQCPILHRFRQSIPSIQQTFF